MYWRFLFLGMASLYAATAQGQSAVSADGVWMKLDAAPAANGREAWIRADRYAVFETSPSLLQSTLSFAPPEDGAQAKSAAPVMTVPMPDGSFARFAVEESPVMAPELAAKFPTIKTYVGRGLDDPAATLRADWTPAGFHAQILSPAGSVYVDPYWRGDTTTYSSYYKRDFPAKGAFHCAWTAPAAQPAATPPAQPALQSATPSGVLGGSVITRRKYRLAVAAQGEYTAFFGGTVTGALAAIVTTVNRVTGIYETELAVRFELIANENLIIYTNATTDPYSANSSTDAVLNENNSNLNAVVGAANYDIGHVVNTGGGGLAGPGPCQALSKADGCTGSSNPQGDPFDVDYVAHEMGHQFNAWHTFNAGTGSCSGNRDAGTAYEPGSGSSILAYAGICTGNNIQPNSDPYFNFSSLTQMYAYITSGSGSGCSSNTVTANHAPTVSAGANYTIPAQTPFMLTATGSDVDGNTVLYSWEERDLGPQANLTTADDGAIPLFRVFPPTTNAARTFPQWSDLLNNVSNAAERLPVAGRTMKFRVVARDVVAGAGGFDFADMQLTVTTAAGPFRVTAPNGGETFNGTQTVTWNVAGTSNAPVNTATVNIWLSTNGGASFTTLLASGTPNDGSETVTIPAVVSSQGRIKVEAAGNVFFDVSDGNFTIGVCTTVTQTNFWTGAVNIPDNSSAGVDIPLAVTGLASVAGIKFRFDGTSCSTTIGSPTVGLDHTWVGDLVVRLISPSGTTNLLLSQPGGVNNSGNNFCQVLLDDGGPTNKIQDIMSAGAPYTGTYRPAGALAAFQGQPANGTWKLRVADIGAGDTGTVRAFSLIISSISCVPAAITSAPPAFVQIAAPAGNVLTLRSVTGSTNLSAEYATNLAGLPLWQPATTSNTWVNGTNTATLVLPTNANPAFIRLLQTP